MRGQSVSAGKVADKVQVVVQECRQGDHGAGKEPEGATRATPNGAAAAVPNGAAAAVPSGAATSVPNNEKYDRTGNQCVRRAIRRHENTHGAEQRSAHG